MKAREFALFHRAVQEGVDRAMHAFWYRRQDPVPPYLAVLASTIVQAVVDSACEWFYFEEDGGSDQGNGSSPGAVD